MIRDKPVLRTMPTTQFGRRRVPGMRRRAPAIYRAGR